VFIFVVVLKTSQHPWYGLGFSDGFEVDGVQGGTLKLTIGKTYVFHNDADCSHPMYISTSIDGPSSLTGSGNVSLGVSGPPIQNVCEGRELTFTPQSSQHGTQFYYQCLNHIRMGGEITICTASGDCTVNAVATTSTTTSSSTNVVISFALICFCFVLLFL